MGQARSDAFLPGPLGGELSQGVGHPQRAEQVHLDGAVQGRVEGHRRRSVNHDVAGAEQASPDLVEGEPVSSHVRGNRANAPGDHLLEAPAELGAQAVEAVVAENLAPGALRGSLVLAGAHEQDDLASGDAPEQALDERRTEEARPPGNSDPPAGEIVGYHECVSSTEVPKSLTISTPQVAQGLAGRAGWAGIGFGRSHYLVGSARAGSRFFGAGRRTGFGGV